MKSFLGWAAIVGVSILLGLGLYSTSLQGAGTSYSEVAATPAPTQTVVKTKVVRKPAKEKIVYVPQSQGSSSGGSVDDSYQAPATSTYVPPAPAARAPVSRPRVAGVSGDNSSGEDHDEDEHDD